ncbi:MAG TPA: Na+/H+ antiporter subunit B [Phycisphaerales bacterium]|nr:Na+/H+ antiporter subunit B [Phycisphaerales bacterium]HRQ76812.1 Na+/H+ antiporter subunit B [Phycisphaerales bacterium]
MRSIILRSATRYLFPIIMLFSIFLLLRGHDEPGGGFIGGLLAATAFVLYAVAYDVSAARTMLRLDVHVFIGTGLLAASLAGIIGIIAGEPFLASQWGTIYIPGLGDMKLGTPLLFDIGVYLVVIGITLMIIFALAEEE